MQAAPPRPDLKSPPIRAPRSDEILVRVGALCGIGAALLALAFPWHSRSVPPLPSLTPEHLVVPGLLMAPFLIALLGFSYRDESLRVGLWIGAGVAGVVAAWTPSFAGVLLGAPAGITVLVGGILAVRDTRPRGRSILIALGLALAGIAAIVLFWWLSPGRSWVASRLPNGTLVWHEVPGNSAHSNFGVTGGSPVVTARGAIVSMIPWMVAAGSLLVLRLLGKSVKRTQTG